MDTADLVEPEAGEDGRSASELATLLVELGRVVKARRFYPPRDPKLAQVFGRGLRAWQVDLERHGPLEVELAQGAFRAVRSGAQVAGHQLGGLAEEFAARELRRARLEPGLDAEAFAGFVELLATEPREVARAGGCARLLYSRVPAGIVVNGTPPSIDPMAEAPEPAPEASTREEHVDLPAARPAEAAPTAAEAAAAETSGAAAEPADPAAAPDESAAGSAEAAEGPAAETGDEQETPPLEVQETGDDAEPQDELGEFVFAERAPDSDVSDTSPEETVGEAPAAAAAASAEEAPGGQDELRFELEDPGRDLQPAEDSELSSESARATEGQGGGEPAWELDFEFSDLRGLGEPSEAAEVDEPLTLETDGDLPAPAGRRPTENDEELQFADEAPRGTSSEDSDTLDLAEPEPARPAAAAGEAAPPAAAAPARPERSREEPRSAPPRRSGVPASALETAPVEAEPSDERATELVETLRELEECEDVGTYGDLARRATVLVERLSEEGLADEAYRALLVFARHASGEAKRASGLAKIADQHLQSLAVGRRLEDLIGRACAPRGSSSVRATQILLQLGESAVPPLLDAAELERDPDRRGQMHGILIAMGEKTLPELLRVMDGDDPGYVKSAVRIAGETQNPGAVAKLEALLAHEDAGIRDEAARALVRVGDRHSIDALVKALVSHTPGLPALAAYCLGVSGSPRAVRPLLAALKEAANAGDVELAREMIRALGRLGRSEATPDLAGILLQRGLLKRRRLRELKVAAAGALGRLPGDDAVGALAQAAQSRDAQIRRAAQIALDRRARSLAGR